MIFQYELSIYKNKALQVLWIGFHNTWLLYQQYAGLGYTQTKTYQYNEDSASIHTCWTQRGRLFLYEFLQSYGIVPLAELYDGDEDGTDDDFEDDASA